MNQCLAFSRTVVFAGIFFTGLPVQAEPILLTSLCTGGEVDVVISEETFGAEDTTRCVATGSITVGPDVSFEDGSDTLLQAPLVTLVSEVEAHAGSLLSLRAFSAVPVRKTGQVTCYDATGNTIGCAMTGQDGELQRGEAWPNPRFTDHGNGTVTDNLTGLVWMADPECLGRFEYPSTTWTEALAAANAMTEGQCGLTDGSTAGEWRIPNVLEFLSLFHFEFAGPALPDTLGTSQWADEDPFTGIHGITDGPPDTYWTSTAYSNRTNMVWTASLYPGRIDTRLMSDTAYQYVWMVRGGGSVDIPAPVPATGQKNSLHAGDDGVLQRGVSWPNPRFHDNLDGTVIDNLTGLIWLKDAGCYIASTWASALSKAARLNDGECGLSDGSSEGEWRLPNALELLSLVDFAYDTPALPDTSGTGQWQEGKPFINLENDYWSSTTEAAGINDRAWEIWVDYGNPNLFLKTTTGHTWPVRGGQ